MNCQALLVHYSAFPFRPHVSVRAALPCLALPEVISGLHGKHTWATRAQHRTQQLQRSWPNNHGVTGYTSQTRSFPIRSATMQDLLLLALLDKRRLLDFSSAGGQPF